jgi:hypothetical protein
VVKEYPARHQRGADAIDGASEGQPVW